MAKTKTFKITLHRNRGASITFEENSLAELIECFSYTLDCGASYQHEKGNKKINKNPKTLKSLVNNLNNAENNAAANGYAGVRYEIS